MIIYTTSFINNYYQSLENKTIDISLLDCLNSILNTINNDISLNTIDNDNDLRNQMTIIIVNLILVITIITTITIITIITRIIPKKKKKHEQK